MDGFGASTQTPMPTGRLAQPVIGGRPEGTRLDRMIAAATGRLLEEQRPDGHWCAELEGDTILESEYVLLLHFLGRGDDPRVRACCERLRNTRLGTGGWSIYSGGPADVSASVKAYLCLKIAGDDVESPPMAAARRAIVEAGGLGACNSYTKLLLAVFGLWSWRDAPAVPPEIVLLPRWFYFNLDEMSAWTRAIVVPLSVVWALKPRARVAVGLEELGGTDRKPARRPAHPVAERMPARGPAHPVAEHPVAHPVAGATSSDRVWSVVFGGVDRLIKFVERVGPVPRWRRRALEEAEAWMTPRLGGDDGLGAIFPAIVNAVFALRALGYEEDHPLVQGQLRALERFEIEDASGGTAEMRLQPCLSPVWDTALSMNALLASDGGGAATARQHGLQWLVDREVTAPGDWQRKSLQQAPGGWCFEYGNDFYPDCDDTAEVLAVLAGVRGENEELEWRRRGAVSRGLRWLRGMQNPDGGWAAFDRRCDKEILTRIPFADHNAMIDPSTADITARAVCALLAHGGDRSDVAVRRGVEFLLRMQESDGSWYGRWGANYVYGTWLALTALSEVGGAGGAGETDGRLPRAMQAGCDWLLGVQNADGGWGESLRSYEDVNAKGRGRSTASQTAWAMLGLIAAGEPGAAAGERSEVGAALERAVGFLGERQGPDGGWEDREWTGVGFPRVFYLRYHGYGVYFPLEALAGYREWSRKPARRPADPVVHPVPS
jgi:squalene-hopene/tetraprenyl-beta-curcumene cyclase